MSPGKPVYARRINAESLSVVAQAEDSAFHVDEGETYAELWMGTHPNGPSRVMRDGTEGSHELEG